MRYYGHSVITARRFYLSQHGADYRLSPHFTLGEFASKDGADAVDVHPTLVEALESIRLFYGRPVEVSSGDRSQDHNDSIPGSSPTSLHIHGLAADIRVRGVSKLDVASYARDALGMGVGYPPGSRSTIHVSVGSEGGADRTITGGSYADFPATYSPADAVTGWRWGDDTTPSLPSQLLDLDLFGGLSPLDGIETFASSLPDFGALFGLDRARISPGVLVAGGSALAAFTYIILARRYDAP